MRESGSWAERGALSAGRALDHAPLDLAGGQPAVARASEELAALGHDLPAEQRHHGPARYRPALPWAVVAHMEILAGQRLPEGGVDEGDVRVAARRDHAVLRVEPEDPGRVGGGDLRKPGKGHAPLDHALGIGDA